MIEVNLKNRAVTEHTRAFNSMCRFGDVYLGASSSGLFTIGGATDNGTAINAAIRSGEFDFGANNNSRFRFIYFSLTTTGRLKLSIYCNKVLVGTYTVIPEDGSSRRVRVPISRVHKGRYWSWKVEGVNGAQYSIHGIDAIPVLLHSGHG